MLIILRKCKNFSLSHESNFLQGKPSQTVLHQFWHAGAAGGTFPVFLKNPHCKNFSLNHESNFLQGKPSRTVLRWFWHAGGCGGGFAGSGCGTLQVFAPGHVVSLCRQACSSRHDQIVIWICIWLSVCWTISWHEQHWSWLAVIGTQLQCLPLVGESLWVARRKATEKFRFQIFEDDGTHQDHASKVSVTTGTFSALAQSLWVILQDCVVARRKAATLFTQRASTVKSIQSYCHHPASWYPLCSDSKIHLLGTVGSERNEV